MPRSAAGPPPGDTDALDAADAELLSAVDAEMARAREVAGPLFRCGPGRSDCCYGPFPVNLLDAWRLQRGLLELAREDPARARALRERVDACVDRLGAGFPGDPATGLIGEDEDAERRFCVAHWELACPALDPATGRCELYAWRPLACRTMGTPVRLGGQDLASCGFCFGPASEEEVERCRARPDPEGREDGLLDAVETRTGRKGETFIAFALAGRPPLR
jgi:Fe-S-cluster containining protein